jgi:hypothetical protein
MTPVRLGQRFLVEARNPDDEPWVARVSQIILRHRRSFGAAAGAG